MFSPILLRMQDLPYTICDRKNPIYRYKFWYRHA